MNLLSRHFRQFHDLRRAVFMSTERPTPRVLCIQSHTVSGFVGNKAAAFPLQCMGYDVNTVNTIVLSNRPGYSGGFRGKECDAEEVSELLLGLAANGMFHYDVVITGYARSVNMLGVIERAIDQARETNADVTVVCDPVLGDHGRFYVPEELLDIYKNSIIKKANIITPNHFELEKITGVVVNSTATALQACQVLHGYGPEVCLLKGLKISGESGPLSMIVSDARQNTMIRIDIPKLEGSFSGCGDLCTAISAAWLTRHRFQLASALELIANTMYHVLRVTALKNSKELCIIECRNCFESPSLLLNPSYVMRGPVVGVIFDMDGTLTEPGAINFAAMYHRIGIVKNKNVDILTQVKAELPSEKHSEAHSIIIDEELKGCDAMILKPDLVDTINYFKTNNIRMAISTRNCEAACNIFQDRTQSHSYFDIVLHRDSLGGINKPDARVAESILTQWSVENPGDVWFVGDSIDDMKCGKGAGCKTCFIGDEVQFGEVDRCLIDLRVDSLTEFVGYLTNFRVNSAK